MVTEQRRTGLRNLKNASYLRKWLILGALIGIVAGVGALLFMTLLEAGTDLLLGALGGYAPATPIGEGNEAGSAAFSRPWAIPLVVGLGGLASGCLTYFFAPEAEGHGTDAAIEAFHHNPRGVRFRAVLVKLTASAVTIGAGGSAGREGPTAQISAGFGSLLGRVLDLSRADARIAVAAGIGSGIGAIFRAPLGGAVLGAEILYRDDLEAEALLPSMVASIIGFSIFGAFQGFTPIFGFVRGYEFHPLQLLYFGVLGVAAGAVGRVYASTFYGVVKLTRHLKASPIVKPALAGVLVGLLGLVFPGVLGTGYGFVQKVMTDPAAVPLVIILAVPFVKILATSLSIGSGGSGGIFGPGMVIGAFVGAGVWHMLHPFAPALPDSPAPFMVVGMAACFGSISHALLAVMLMVAEMTGSLALLPPAMLATFIAALVVGEATIYTGQLKDRVESPAHRLKFGLPLLSSISVESVMSPPRLVLGGSVGAKEALDQLVALRLPGAPVADKDGVFDGSVETERLRHQLDGDDQTVSDLSDRQCPSVTINASLDDVIDALAMNGVTWVTVLDTARRAVGIVGMKEVIIGYRRTLRSSLLRFGEAVRDTVLVEHGVGDASRVAGSTIGQTRWPAGTVVVSVQRGSNLLFPEANTELQAGDVVSVLARPANAEHVRAFLRGDGQEPEPGGRRGPEMI